MDSAQGSSAVRMERMSKYIFTAPRWPASLVILLILGLLIELLSRRLDPSYEWFGILGFVIPGFLAFLLTRPLIVIQNRQMTWNRGALLATTCTLFSCLITLIGLILLRDLVDLCYAISLGFIFGVRLLVLVSISDYRTTRMVIPAAIQSIAGWLLVSLILPGTFPVLAPMLMVFFGTGFTILIWLIDRPLYRAFHIRGLKFLNAFIAHLTDGDKGMEDFFRDIGQQAWVPQVSIFFSRAGKKDVIFTIPNVHPGPMGEIGGGNLPSILRSRFEEEMMVAHGCATHDYNLVSESEIDKIVTAINETKSSLEWHTDASKPGRIQFGTVSLLYQRIGDALLMVSTRSPDKTEDIDFGIGHAIICEGHKITPHIGFVDAHNCLGEEIDVILPGTRTAHEYFTAASQAMDQWETILRYPLKAGYAHLPLPYSREEGIGDIGLQVLVTEAGGVKTAYILIDGNNMAQGVRERIRDEVLTLVDEAEVMTSDTHVVNTISGKNPVGQNISPDELIIHVLDGVEKALLDCSDAKAAGSSATCNGVVIFGSDSIAQLASIVNTILVYVVPISAGMLLLAVVLSVIAYMVIT
ncbi:DUF2070 family protein [Methanospirillum stamsii]|uniref:DUF2070 domain-containing protein n=1 Tax=Methanospirillum stamsii TaxID=1277351 RepID=A0A2V2N4Z5_9EURY|nr:DUF2070 family protein [Methanospirillum stamsii]PWR70333.1 DUF2070 domain-containing protein [Methanospirillum stamsii]